MKQVQLIHFKIIILKPIFFLILGIVVLFSKSAFSYSEEELEKRIKELRWKELQVYTDTFKWYGDTYIDKNEEIFEKITLYKKGYKPFNTIMDLISIWQDTKSAAEDLANGKNIDASLNILSSFLTSLGKVKELDKKLVKLIFRGAISASTISLLITAAKTTYDSFKELEKENIDFNFFMSQQDVLGDPVLSKKVDNPFLTDTVVRYDNKAIEYYLKYHFLSSPKKFCSFANEKYPPGCPNWGFWEWQAIWEFENYGVVDKEKYKKEGIDIDKLLNQWKKEKIDIKIMIHQFLKDLNKVQLAHLRAMALRNDLHRLSVYLNRNVKNLEEARGTLNFSLNRLRYCNKLAANIRYDENWIYEVASCFDSLNEIPPLRISGIREKKKEVYKNLCKALENYRKYKAKITHEKRIKILSKKVSGYSLPPLSKINYYSVENRFFELFKKYYKDPDRFNKMRNELYFKKIENSLKVHNQHIKKVNEIIEDLEETIKREERESRRRELENKKSHMEYILRVLRERVEYLQYLARDLDARLQFLLSHWQNSLNTFSQTIQKMNDSTLEFLKKAEIIKRNLEEYAAYPLESIEETIKELKQVKEFPIPIITPTYISSQCDKVSSYSVPFPNLEALRCFNDRLVSVLLKCPNMFFCGYLFSMDINLHQIEGNIQEAKLFLEEIEMFKDYIEKNFENIEHSQRFRELAEEILKLKLNLRIEEIFNNYNKVLKKSAEISALIPKAEERVNKFSRLLKKALEIYPEAEKHYQECKENERWADALNSYVVNKLTDLVEIFNKAAPHSYEKYKIFTCSSKGKEYTLVSFLSPIGMQTKEPILITSQKLAEIKEGLRSIYASSSGIIGNFLPKFKQQTAESLNFFSKAKVYSSSDAVIFPQNKSIYDKCILEKIYKTLKDKAYVNLSRVRKLLKSYELKPEYFSVNSKYYLVLPNNRDLQILLRDIRSLIWEYPNKIKKTVFTWEERYKESEKEIKELKADLSVQLSKFKQGEDVIFPETPEEPIKKVLDYIELLNSELESGEIYISGIGKMPLTSQAKAKLSNLRNKFEKLKEEWFEFWKKLQEEIEKTSIEIRYKLDPKASIWELYTEFTRCYINKNLPCILELISENWSASDGTTIDEMEEILENSFDIFDRIEYKIKNFRVEPQGNGIFRVYYKNEIIGYIFSQNITHKEGYEVIEEVGLENGEVKILKTLKGQFWKR